MNSKNFFFFSGVPQPHESVKFLCKHIEPEAWTWECDFLLSEFAMSRIAEPKKEKKSHNQGQFSTRENEESFIKLVERRASHEPIQYLIGNWDFRKLKNLKLRAPVLIPRPETEQLVDLVHKVCGFGTVFK